MEGTWNLFFGGGCLRDGSRDLLSQFPGTYLSHLMLDIWGGSNLLMVQRYVISVSCFVIWVLSQNVQDLKHQQLQKNLNEGTKQAAVAP